MTEEQSFESEIKKKIMGVIIKNQSGCVSRDVVGKTISIIGGKTFINGEPINELNDIGEERVINITIEGNVERLEVECCKTITVKGGAKRVHTHCGDIDICGDVEGDVHTNCGSINCGNVGGDCHTNMGSITCKK